MKVVFLYKDLILKRNFKSMATGGLEQGAGSPCSDANLSSLSELSNFLLESRFLTHFYLLSHDNYT